MLSAITHVITLACESLELTLSYSFTVRCFGPFQSGYPSEDGQILPYPRSTRWGYATGRFLRNNSILSSLVELVSMAFHLLIYRRFQERCHDPQKFIYFAYSEPHQFTHFFGAGGCFEQIQEYVLCENWRDSWEVWKDDPTQKRGSPFEQLVRDKWCITNMSHDLPFVLVFIKRYRPVPMSLNEVYRQRRKDGGRALRQREQQLLSIIKKKGLKAYAVDADET